MDVTSRCTLGDPNKLPEGVPQPARMPYISDKHPRQTLEVINLLRKHRELCDVVLVVGAKKIYAHRVILSACSPYFRAMFTGELAESRQTEVVIRDIDERAMELLIDFAYTSQITVEEGNVQTLLPAACLLQLAEIQEACCEFLKRQLDPSNCLGIRAFADTHSCRELLRIADKFTQHNFQEVRSPSAGTVVLESCGLLFLCASSQTLPSILLIEMDTGLSRGKRAPAGLRFTVVPYIINMICGISSLGVLC